MNSNLRDRLDRIERQLGSVERQIAYCEDNNLTEPEDRFNVPLKWLVVEFTNTYRLLVDDYKGVWEK